MLLLHENGLCGRDAPGAREAVRNGRLDDRVGNVGLRRWRVMIGRLLDGGSSKKIVVQIILFLFGFWIRFRVVGVGVGVGVGTRRHPADSAAPLAWNHHGVIVSPELSFRFAIISAPLKQRVDARLRWRQIIVDIVEDDGGGGRRHGLVCVGFVLNEKLWEKMEMDKNRKL